MGVHIALRTARRGKSANKYERCPLSAFAESFRTAVALVLEVDPILWRTVRLSLLVSVSACAIAAGFGLAGGAWLAVARFPGRRALLALLNTLLALPSVVVGLVVYLLLSRSGPLGAWGILFTPGAMVIAQTILVLPVIAALSRQLVADSLRDGGDQLRSMGAPPFTCALLMLLHERWAVATILLTAFGRAVSEVGAVMIVGGNIDGVTRVITTTIALETSKGDLPLALALGLVLLALVGLVNAGIAMAQRTRFVGMAAAAR
jgi:tungstate transport system permease protein